MQKNMFRVVSRNRNIRKTNMYNNFCIFCETRNIFSRNTKLVSLEIIMNFVRTKLGSGSTTLTVTTVCKSTAPRCCNLLLFLYSVFYMELEGKQLCLAKWNLLIMLSDHQPPPSLSPSLHAL